MSHPRKIILLFLSAVVLIFVMQNLTIVEIDFLFWSMRVPRALLIFLVFVIGGAVGFLIDQSTTQSSDHERE